MDVAEDHNNALFHMSVSDKVNSASQPIAFKKGENVWKCVKKK